MTTGRPQTFDTPWGMIEFVHTARNGKDLSDGVTFDVSRRIHVATPQRAWKSAFFYIWRRLGTPPYSLTSA
jgi:hypothetical protein